MCSAQFEWYFLVEVFNKVLHVSWYLSLLQIFVNSIPFSVNFNRFTNTCCCTLTSIQKIMVSSQLVGWILWCFWDGYRLISLWSRIFKGVLTCNALNFYIFFKHCNYTIWRVFLRERSLGWLNLYFLTGFFIFLKSCIERSSFGTLSENH